MSRFVFQTNPELPDCLSACVSTLLGIPGDDVPLFRTENGERQMDALNRWLAPHGFYAVELRIDGTWYPPGLWICFGPAPHYHAGDMWHAVVALGDDIIHDPHPGGIGLAGRGTAVLLVPTDPSDFLPG